MPAVVVPRGLPDLAHRPAAAEIVSSASEVVLEDAIVRRRVAHTAAARLGLCQRRSVDVHDTLGDISVDATGAAPLRESEEIAAPAFVARARRRTCAGPG